MLMGLRSEKDVVEIDYDDCETSHEGMTTGASLPIVVDSCSVTVQDIHKCICLWYCWYRGQDSFCIRLMVGGIISSLET